MATYPELHGRVALITGAAGGLGKATAKAFLEQGAKVALVDISRDALEAVADEFGSPDVLVVPADVSKAEDVENYVKATTEKFGRIDAFFNNAGIEGKVAPIVDQVIADFDRVVAINIRGTWLGMHFVLPVMYQQRAGSVINTSSIGGLSAGPMPVSPYVTSKFAMTGMTRIAAQESAPYQVRVNSIHPSPVNTRMMRSLEAGSDPADAAAVQAEISKTIPLGRYAESSDIANLVLFLASDDSSFVTGSQYRIDGGMLS